MSYHQGSDISLPFGSKDSENTENPQEKIKQHWASFASLVKNNKTRLIAWIVSHCKTKSQRENYVGELKKHIKVDVFGKCGMSLFSSCRRSGIVSKILIHCINCSNPL